TIFLANVPTNETSTL
ncbi:hypothetical protein EC950183_4012, partial [Escherichia coli 95.0183]